MAVSDIKPYTMADLGRNNRPDQCWLLINDQIWDFTEFAPRHPGGVHGTLHFLASAS